jgi:hypothetical protein
MRMPNKKIHPDLAFTEDGFLFLLPGLFYPETQL